MSREVGIIDFTVYLLDAIRNNRQYCLDVIRGASNIQDMLQEILKKKAYEYANFFYERRSLRKIWESLKKIDQDCSQQVFQNTIDQIKAEVIPQLNIYKLDIEGKYFSIGILTQCFGTSNFGGQKNDRGQLHSMKTETKSRGNDKKESGSSISSWFNEIKPSSKKDIESPDNSHKSQNSSKNNSFQFSKPEPAVIPSQNSSPSKADISPQKGTETISAGNLTVQIRFESSSVDYDQYSYNGFSLKQNLQDFVKKYLKENTIIIKNSSKDMLIMEDISFIKSKDAGNYRFNPLCDCLEIWIRRKDGKFLERSFNVNGQDYQFVSKPMPPTEWKKKLISLSPKSPVKDLIVMVCQKRQQKKEIIEQLETALTQQGGANIVEDLFIWQKAQYNLLKIKPALIFQIQEITEQIKDLFNIKSEDPLSDQKKECIKTANSHKILRYAVYKLKGKEGVKQIAWLNMDNLKKAFAIVSKEIQNKQLLDQLLAYFEQFALNPNKNSIKFSRGMVLYGPPGTGKTQLTEALPQIIGFHLISKGLSAADFMKSLVGQTSRMIKDLVNRATVSPYLMCSVGIDQVDGLVPDRKDKDEKNKAEGISILLSVIGGNKDVPNLTYMTSTNYLKKIDEAIRRRLSGQYQVGRPNPEQRKAIIIKMLDIIKDKQSLLEHIIKITTNFTGAALKGLATMLLKGLIVKEMNKKKAQLTIGEITDAAEIVARQFSITLGVYTLPEIYRTQGDKKFLFTEGFLKRISNQILLVKHIRDDTFGIMYATEIKKYINKELKPFYEKEEDKITITIQTTDPFESFVMYMDVAFKKKNYNIVTFNLKQFGDYNKYLKEVEKFLSEREKYKSKPRTVLIIQDFPGKQGKIKADLKLFERNKRNLYIVYYVLSEEDLKQFSKDFFREWESSNTETMKMTKYRAQGQRSKNEPEPETESMYSGRIMVELNEETRMAFQLKNCLEQESKVAFRLFLKSQTSNSPKDVIPELVDFFTKQQASYILLIDYELLLQNDAFEEKKMLEIMEEKMMEAKNYKKVAVIINLDSLIILNESASDSNMGRSMSYSIQNHTMYQIILSYMREFGSTGPGVSRWMTVIVKHPELIKIVKGHLDWPEYPQEEEKRKENERMEVKHRCIRCDAIYTERQNQEEKKCMQHPGRIIDMNNCSLVPENYSVDDLKTSMLLNKGKDNKSDENRFVYACCLKSINEQGHVPYAHINENDDVDEVANERTEKYMKWKEVQEKFEKVKAKMPK